jgi:hypothetical protein
MILTLARGHDCPKEHGKVVNIPTDDHHATPELRASQVQI